MMRRPSPHAAGLGALLALATSCASAPRPPTVEVSTTRGPGAVEVPPTADDGSFVIITAYPMPPGTVATSTAKTRVELRLGLESNPGTRLHVPTRVDRRVRIRREVLSSSPPSVRVTFLEYPEANGSPSSIEGKTFVATRIDGEWALKGEHGQAVAEEEEQRGRRALSSSFAEGKERVSFPSRPLRAGEEVPELTAQLAERLNELPSALGRNATLSVRVREVREVDGERCAVFAIAGVVRGGEPETLELRMDLRGEFVVRLRGGWDVAFDLEGAVQMKAAPGSRFARAASEGKVESSYRVTYP